MPEDIVLKHTDSSVQPWIVPVPEGQTPEDVADAHAAYGWSLSTAHPDVAGNVVEAPPLGGKGSGVEEWRVYAATFTDVAVEDDVTRDDIVAALKQAGHPVEPSEK